LAERGHEVHVLTSLLDKDTPNHERRDGIHIHRYPCAGIIWGVNPATFIMHRLLRDRPDVIHAHSYIFFTSNQAAFAKKLTGTPFLLHLHGGIDFSSPTNDLLTSLKFHLKKRLYDPTVGRWTGRTADAVASVSRRDMEFAKKLWDLDEENLHWIPNAIDPNEFKGKGHDRLLNVAFVGRLEAWKGIQVFIEAAKLIMKETDDVDFLIVGEGAFRENIENGGFDNHIKVLGKVPHKMMPDILCEASVLVLPSYIEGLPTVCLEALAAQVPVVASNVGGTPEVVIDGKTGYLFSPGDSQTCAKKVLKLLFDEELRRKMGSQGRSLMEKSYTWPRVVEKVETLYERISHG